MDTKVICNKWKECELGKTNNCQHAKVHYAIGFCMTEECTQVYSGKSMPEGICVPCDEEGKII